MRIRQANKVYRVESNLRAKILDQLMEEEEALSFMEGVLQKEKIKIPSRVEFFSSCGKSILLGKIIYDETCLMFRFNVWGLYKTVILHEIAHVIAGLDDKHGPLFCYAFSELIREHIPEAYPYLVNLYDRHKIKWT